MYLIMENKIDLKALKDEFDNFSNIPKQLCKYIVNIVNRKVTERFLQVLMGPSAKKTLETIDQRFEKASKILQLSPSEIAKALDFHPNDIGEGRIDAFFAELRIIFWLYYQKFQNITPLQAKSKRRADFYAEFNSFKYVVEVFCIIKKNYKWPNHKKKKHNLIQYYIDRAKEKKDQIDGAAKDFRCDKKIIALVLNSETAGALYYRSKFLQMLQDISNKLNWGKNYHFALITGMETLGEGLDDIVYPDI